MRARSRTLGASRARTTAHSATSPAMTGNDQALIAYSVPIAIAAQASSSAAGKRAGGGDGPLVATCSPNASASSENGIAITCPCRSASVNEKAGNSLIVPLITRDAPNQSYWRSGPLCSTSSRPEPIVPARMHSATPHSPITTRPPIAYASPNAATTESAKNVATARL